MYVFYDTKINKTDLKKKTTKNCDLVVELIFFQLLSIFFSSSFVKRNAIFIAALNISVQKRK